MRTATSWPFALALLVLGGGAMPAHGQAVRGVLGNGGAPASGGGVVLQGTAGQGAVGLSAGPDLRLGHGFWCYAGSQVVGVPLPPGAGAPRRLTLGPTQPSPARGAVRFALSMPDAGNVELAVYDAAGRKVRGGFSRQLAAGSHRLDWHAPGGITGVYFARVTVDGQFVGARRIVLVR
ncbi:MAG: T9SS type A sorting domain-containing protein [Candidatus Eisenbacteria bacterium]|nr:T9SS type A sorting domain-containing protein [Candidatus Eisenbacteria bacterium]